MSCTTTDSNSDNNIIEIKNDNTNGSIVELKLRRILNSNVVPTLGTTNFRKWFLQQFNNDECSLEEFALYFFNGIRHQAYIHLRPAESMEDNFEENRIGRDVKENRAIAASSFQLSSFPELGTTVGREYTQQIIRNSSTPTRKSLNTNSPKHAQTSQNPTRRSFDNVSNRHNTSTPQTKNNNRSHDKSRNSTGGGDTSIGSSSFCLGDFLTSPTVSSRHSNSQKKKITPNVTSTPNNNSNNNSNTKPRKRVVPISIGKTATTVMGTASSRQNSCAFGEKSSFSQENNIQKLSNTDNEMKDFNQRSVAEERKALKQEISEVSSVIKASAVTDITQSVHKLHLQNTIQIESNEKTTRSIPDNALEKIPKKIAAQLKLLGSIYGLLLDMNLTINILQEISLLLNLLDSNMPIEMDNSESNTNQSLKKMENKDTIYESKNVFDYLFKEVINCIFFALYVLEDQQHTLILIDTKSLGVVMQCERLTSLSPTLSSNLNSVYVQKQSFSNGSQYNSSISIGGLKNVCFQEDTDSRKSFYNDIEFGAFKTQRDLFYITLKHWEKHHLYPTWNFTLELGKKVREIFRQSENSINMIHFAKLFVSQLLISANEHTSPEEFGIGMDDIDLKKFTKLSQRLVAPSDFSVDYQFPREQAFFRDFIIESRSIAFMEHLKIILFSELVTLNDSTFEELNSIINPNNIESSYEENEFIVNPQSLSSMLILAKFLGFVSALPFQNSKTQTTIIQNEQLCLRRLFQPGINISQILEISIKKGRHLITLPWLVQYLAMLDDITLQLDNYMETIKKLYSLYAGLGNTELQITPTSAFIIRCCLGWLFDKKPSIGVEYLNYHRMTAVAVIHSIEENKSIETIEDIKEINNSIIKFEAAKADLQLKPILDIILSVACPFLAEFRVSIMQASKLAMTKNVSRSGRFRHITPCIAETSNAQKENLNSNVLGKQSNIIESKPTTSEQRQKLLMESFLHSQNSSIRRLIVFLTERVYKCVVKDAQYQILIPSKESADNEINKITESTDQNDVLEQVERIYQNAHNEVNKKWNIEIPEMINDRIKRGLDALLSIEITPILKTAYAWHIKCEASMKIEQWRHMNLYKQDFYCNDINELATKICKVNAINRLKQSNYQTTELILVQSQPRVSDLIEELQYWLYTTGFETSFKPEMWSDHTSTLQRDAALINFIERLKSSFINTLPTIYYRLIGAGLIQILQQMIAATPLYITDDLIEVCCKFLLDKNICIADAAVIPIKDFKNSKISVEMESPVESIDYEYDANTSTISNSQQPAATTAAAAAATTTAATTTTSIYQSLITAPFLQSLGSSSLSYEKLKALLHAMIQAGIVTMGFVNDLFMTAFKEDLDVIVLNSISKMLYELAQKNKDDSLSALNMDENADCESELKSQLFMEVLADLSRSLDDF